MTILPSKVICRAITYSFGFAVLFLFSACGAVHTPDLSNTPTLDLSSTTQDLNVLEALSKGEKLEKPLIIKVPQGFSLPVQVVVDTPLATMESNCSQMVFKQDLFLYVSNQGMLAGPAIGRWADISDMDAVKELFGGDKGEVTVSIGAGEEKGAQLDVKVTVHPKTK